jgi:hypothetical protein
MSRRPRISLISRRPPKFEIRDGYLRHKPRLCPSSRTPSKRVEAACLDRIQKRRHGAELGLTTGERTQKRKIACLSMASVELVHRKPQRTSLLKTEQYTETVPRNEHLQIRMILGKSPAIILHSAQTVLDSDSRPPGDQQNGNTKMCRFQTNFIRRGY